MYLNTTVKIPEIKGKIITKKKGTTTYIRKGQTTRLSLNPFLVHTGEKQ